MEDSVALLSNDISCAHPTNPPQNEENLKSVQEESLNNGVEELTHDDIDTCSLKGHTGGYVNDAILNFILKWMSRHELKNKSEFLCINSLRVGKIMKGEQCASSSKSMKSLHIFKQKVLVLPYNESMHWSVFFVVFPDRLNKKDEGHPFIFHLDPLKGVHCIKKIHINICWWLCTEWCAHSEIT